MRSSISTLIRVVAVLLLALLAGVVIGRSGQGTVLYFPVSGMEHSRGMKASYWPTACTDLDDLNAKLLIGGHPHAPACVSSRPDIGYTPVLDWRDLSRVPVPAKYLLTINEPEGCGPQSFFGCLEPWEAVPIMKQIVDLYVGEYILAYPALLAPDDNMDWVVDFRNAYIAAYGAPPPLGVLPFHCYGPAYYCIDKAQHFVGLCNSWPECQEVWVEEFGQRIGENFSYCPWSQADWQQELVDQIDYYRNDPTITRWYFLTNRMAPDWYEDFPCAPVTHAWSNGALLEQGQIYGGWIYP